MSVLRSSSLPVELLLSLTPAEIRKFRQLLDSAYFNSKPLVSQLFDYLLKRRKTLDNKGVERSHIYAHLLPDEPYSVNHFNKLLFQLHELLQQFLITEALAADPLLEKMLLLRQLGTRATPLAYRKHQRTANAMLTKLPTRDGAYFLHGFQLNHEQQRTLHTTSTADEQSIEAQIHQLDNTYLFFRLKMECEHLNRQRIYTTSTPPTATQELLDFIATDAIQLEPTVTIYRDIILLLLSPVTVTKFVQVFTTFATHRTAYQPAEARVILHYFLNYAYYQFNRQRKEFLAPLLRLFRYGLEYDILLLNGYLTDQTFKNIVTVGLANKELEWTEQFIEQYESRIEPTGRADARSFAYANLYYQRGAYRRAAAALQAVDYRIVKNQLSARALALRLYYEDSQQPAPQMEVDLEQQIEAYLRWLYDQRTTFSAKRLEEYQNFCRIVGKLYHYRHAPLRRSADYAQLKTKIKSYHPCTFHLWVAEQLEQLAPQKG